MHKQTEEFARAMEAATHAGEQRDRDYQAGFRAGREYARSLLRALATELAVRAHGDNAYQLPFGPGQGTVIVSWPQLRTYQAGLERFFEEE
jgi:hypothetical protein